MRALRTFHCLTPVSPLPLAPAVSLGGVCVFVSCLGCFVVFVFVSCFAGVRGFLFDHSSVSSI